MGVTDPDVYDHFREVADGDDEGELFRVVGVDERQVTLLRLTDGGDRTATGDLRRVDREEFAAAFEAGANPDPRFGYVDYLAGLFVLGGGSLAAVSPDDRLAGLFLAGVGLYLLWRRHG